jgi:hypothetical protein
MMAGTAPIHSRLEFGSRCHCLWRCMRVLQDLRAAGLYAERVSEWKLVEQRANRLQKSRCEGRLVLRC